MVWRGVELLDTGCVFCLVPLQSAFCYYSTLNFVMPMLPVSSVESHNDIPTSQSYVFPVVRRYLRCSILSPRVREALQLARREERLNLRYTTVALGPDKSLFSPVPSSRYMKTEAVIRLGGSWPQ